MMLVLQEYGEHVEVLPCNFDVDLIIFRWTRSLDVIDGGTLAGMRK
jgi:hypothetical protein